jgi:hypothetical protein
LSRAWWITDIAGNVSALELITLFLTDRAELWLIYDGRARRNAGVSGTDCGDSIAMLVPSRFCRVLPDAKNHVRDHDRCRCTSRRVCGPRDTDGLDARFNIATVLQGIVPTLIFTVA